MKLLDEVNEKLSNEIVENLKNVQERIYEVNYNVPEYRLRKLEIQAILQGLVDWLFEKGFGDIEVYYLIKDLDFEKEFYVN